MSVRNVTACPLAGICREETFDTTPYAKACSRFLMGHPDTQDFGRKVKIAFSGCAQNPCGLVTMHDMGAIAKTKVVDGKVQRGFAFYVGGGLGSVPYKAKLFDEFLPEEELLPTMQAISRVFARLGEKRNRARARIKFLIANLGIDEFRKLVLDERQKLLPDPRWTAYLASVNEQTEDAHSSPESISMAISGWKDSTPGTRRMSTSKDNPAMSPPRLRCRWAMPAPISCARSPTSRGDSLKTRCARRWSKIFSSAG